MNVLQCHEPGNGRLGCGPQWTEVTMFHGNRLTVQMSDWRLLFILVFVGGEVLAADTIDYTRDVRPILAQNCFTCHGPDEGTLEAGLRLDHREAATRELDSGEVAIVPGHPENSEMWTRLTAEEDYLRMPPPETGRELTPEQIDLLRRWIEQGARYTDHWAFQPPVAASLPEVQDRSWPRNEIDAFVLARLEREGIAPSPEADRETLIRRLSLDLLGLPPSPDEVEQFVRSKDPEAYEQLVDRLLDSPHFGERWGRHWLDLARFADSDGYLGDSLRPNIWRYRDWVIDAINRDMPFDQFTIEQIAGDLLPDATLEQKIATGFHRNSLKNTEAGADRELDRVVRTVDRTRTVGTIWLGLTLGCAECHTHKYDPITHEEFFQMFAFFNNLEDQDISAAPPDIQAAYEAAYATWKSEVNEVKSSISLVIDALNQKRVDGTELVRDELLAIIRAEESKRKPDEEELLKECFSLLNESERALFDDYKRLADSKPDEPKQKAPTVADASKKRQTYIHLRGDYRQPGDPVEPGTLKVLPPLKTDGESPNRLDLARWLVAPDHPLTPRTAVNHVWTQLFGRGIVATNDDFGSTGDSPSHPDLLDWLAVTFRESGWSRKQLIKRIVTSATYRQVSHVREDLLEIDPMNVLLARQSRFRLEAEVIRDIGLAASGLLEPKVGGPSVRPVMNTRVTEISRNKSWEVSSGTDKYRRGMYILFRRGTPYPMLTTFDAPDSTVSCTRRERSNSPLQALTLLNDPVFFECAQHLGQRLIREADSSARDRIVHAYRVCLGRSPTEAEAERALAFVDQQRSLLEDLDRKQLADFVGSPLPDVELHDQAVCVALARVLFNLDEFITRE